MEISSYNGSMNAVRSGVGYAYPVQNYSNEKLEPVSSIPSVNYNESLVQESGVMTFISEEAQLSYENSQGRQDNAQSSSISFVSSDSYAQQEREEGKSSEVHLPNAPADIGFHMDILA